MNRIFASLASLAFCAPLLASAADGYVVADISLQAGPDPAYPSITELSAGTPVSIQGCLDGWSWCDVIAVRDRGWVPGTFLQEDYGGQRVIVTDYGMRIGIPVIAFSIGAYWDHHYHDRPFYSQRQQWESRAITVHAPPRPSGAASTARTDSQAPQRQHAGAAEQAPLHQTPVPAPATDATASSRQRATSEQQRVQSERATQERVAKANNPAMQQKPQQQPKPEPQPESAPAPAKPSDQAPQAKPEQHPAQAPKPMASAKQQEPPKEKPKAQQPKPKDELQAPKKKDDNKDKDNGGG
jgi:uncharacterized protein YraI